MNDSAANWENLQFLDRANVAYDGFGGKNYFVNFLTDASIIFFKTLTFTSAKRLT
jgi:hypothetical protein